MIKSITPCLWFDNQAEEAVNYYVSIFPNSSIGSITRFGKEGFEHHQMPEGTVMTIAFKLNGQDFLALNGGPIFRFSEAISFQIPCKDQQEIDFYWERLTAGGEEQPCGWLKDRFGLSWQVVPEILPSLMSNPMTARAVSQAFFKMKKFDIATLEAAAATAV